MSDNRYDVIIIGSRPGTDRIEWPDPSEDRQAHRGYRTRRSSAARTRERGYGRDVSPRPLSGRRDMGLVSESLISVSRPDRFVGGSRKAFGPVLSRLHEKDIGARGEVPAKIGSSPLSEAVD
jgi:hypothetical protein